jgi:hypothetical protein
LRHRSTMRRAMARANGYPQLTPVPARKRGTEPPQSKLGGPPQPEVPLKDGSNLGC